MRSEDIEYITEKLKKKLTPGRFTHTMGVAYTAACMAMRFGEDMEKAYIAGLLHDCAKCISDEEKKVNRMASKSAQVNMPIRHFCMPNLVHGTHGTNTTYMMNRYAVQ